MISQPNKWRAEWSNSPALQEQFPSAESYAEHRAKLERESGAAAPMSEADRLAGIDAAALPGHETLIAEMKADPTVKPGQAAVRIAAAEKARRAQEAPPPRNVTQVPRRVSMFHLIAGRGSDNAA